MIPLELNTIFLRDGKGNRVWKDYAVIKSIKKAKNTKVVL